MQAEQEMCSMVEGKFDSINNIYWPQHNETIKSLQFCKLSRKSSESAEERMGRLRIAVAECNYKEKTRQLMEQFK